MSGTNRFSGPRWDWICFFFYASVFECVCVCLPRFPDALNGRLPYEKRTALSRVNRSVGFPRLNEYSLGNEIYTIIIIMAKLSNAMNIDECETRSWSWHFPIGRKRNGYGAFHCRDNRRGRPSQISRTERPNEINMLLQN